MKFFAFLNLAVKSLLSNKLRSSLTMLGIIIGVGAVITLVSVGQGAQASVTSIYQGLGSNLLNVQPRNPEAPGISALSPQFTTPTLTLDDAKTVETLPGIIGVAPVNENFVNISFGTETVAVIVEGSTPFFETAYNYHIDRGRFVSQRDIDRKDLVVVLGSKVAGDLFGPIDPVGQTVKMKGKSFTVIGLFQTKGGAFFGVSMDDIAIIPITTFATRIGAQRTASGEDAVQSMSVQVVSSDMINTVKDEITQTLRKRHRILPDKKNDFAVVSQEQILGVFDQITGIFTIFLGSIAGISLLVGSIGIMNIMLVSVTERTREIGLRKAIGAKRRDILTQFLLEAAMLSVTGGVIGVTGGSTLAKLISIINFGGTTINAVVSPGIIILALSVSIIIGLASGIYPAVRASRLKSHRSATLRLKL